MQINQKLKMTKYQNKIISFFLILTLPLICTNVVKADNYKWDENKKLKVEISKSGLNRISNPPYKIVQVAGDDSKFRLKYDEDGANIYFMPIVKVGESCEINIRNNAGLVQDLELIVTNDKGKSIIIDAIDIAKINNLQLSNVSLMLGAMRDDVEDKFYVQNKRQKPDNVGSLKVYQTKIYKYRELAGGVFEIKNQSKKDIAFDLPEFASRFNNVKASYASMQTIPKRTTATVLIVQKLEDK